MTGHSTANPGGLAPWSEAKGQLDVLFECSGAAPALVGAIPALRPGGIIVQLGLGGDMMLPVQAMTAKELSLTGSFRFHAEFFTAVSLMRKGLIDPRPLITGTYPLREAEAVFRVAGDRSHSINAQIAFG